MRPGPGPEQPVDQPGVAIPDRPVQRGRAVRRRLVRIRASIEQRDRLCLFGCLGRAHEPQVLRRGVRGECRQHTGYEQ
jgi:hypothetical protein